MADNVWGPFSHNAIAAAGSINGADIDMFMRDSEMTENDPSKYCSILSRPHEYNGTCWIDRATKSQTDYAGCGREIGGIQEIDISSVSKQGVITPISTI